MESVVVCCCLLLLSFDVLCCCCLLLSFAVVVVIFCCCCYRCLILDKERNEAEILLPPYLPHVQWSTIIPLRNAPPSGKIANLESRRSIGPEIGGDAEGDDSIRNPTKEFAPRIWISVQNEQMAQNVGIDDENRRLEEDHQFDETLDNRQNGVLDGYRLQGRWRFFYGGWTCTYNVLVFQQSNYQNELHRRSGNTR